METWYALAARGELGPGKALDDCAWILRSGEEATLCYFLAEGAAEIFHSSDDGFSVVVKVVQSPSLLASPEMCGGEPRYLENARSAGRAKVYAMPRARFLAILRSDVNAGFETLVDLSQAFTSTARYEPSRLFEAETILATLLLAYVEVFGEAHPKGVRITLRRSQAEIAAAIGAGERSVNRILAVWKEQSFLHKTSGHYIVTDVPALTALAGPLAGSLVHRYRPVS